MGYFPHGVTTLKVKLTRAFMGLADWRSGVQKPPANPPS